MFKPNVRGVSKRSLKFGLAGWQSSESFMIQHRYPWRRNWVEKLAADDSLRPLLARSGNVYLSKRVDATELKKSTHSSKKRLAIYGYALFALIFLLTSQIVIIENPIDSSFSKPAISRPAARETSSVVNCESIMKDPEGKIREWLAGRAQEQLTISETQRSVLGGVQLRVILVSCGQLRRDFNLTLTLTQGEWKLKKFTRLEN